MDGKKQPKQAPSSSSPPGSSSLVADLFGGKNAPNSSSSSFFHSVFPPASTVMGRDSWKQAAQSPSWKGHNVNADGAFHGSGSHERGPAYQHEKIDPCSFSSSLYYGGQDICANAPTSHGPGYNVKKKDGEDDSNNPNAASRGNWWQGSLYY